MYYKELPNTIYGKSGCSKIGPFKDIDIKENKHRTKLAQLVETIPNSLPAVLTWNTARQSSLS
jgi:hypothetical protein